MFASRGRTAAALSLAAALLMMAGVLLLPGLVASRLVPQALQSGIGLRAIPARYLAWYAAAARTCPGLRWEVLAGIGTIESDNGRSQARGVHYGKNRKGAEGPMQFEPATFAEYAVWVDRSARLSPYNPPDAIFSAARMLCANGAGDRSGRGRGLREAIFAYNHARWYVRDVLALAGRYTVDARWFCSAWRSHVRVKRRLVHRHPQRHRLVHRHPQRHRLVRRGRRRPGWCGLGRG
jgi:hypothetical protein